MVMLDFPAAPFVAIALLPHNKLDLYFREERLYSPISEISLCVEGQRVLLVAFAVEYGFEAVG